MLVIAACCLTCVAAPDTTPTTAQQTEGAAAVADTVPFGNRFGLPFTRDEYKRSLRQIKPEEEAEFLTRVIYEPDPEAIGIGISDTNLLLLAALSEDVAQRVIAYRPKLRDQVLWIRENREAFIAGFWSNPGP